MAALITKSTVIHKVDGLTPISKAGTRITGAVAEFAAKHFIIGTSEVEVDFTALVDATVQEILVAVDSAAIGTLSVGFATGVTPIPLQPGDCMRITVNAVSSLFLISTELSTLVDLVIVEV